MNTIIQTLEQGDTLLILLIILVVTILFLVCGGSVWIQTTLTSWKKRFQEKKKGPN